jgi:hypothetical protein
MNEKKDRTIPIVTIIVIAGMLISCVVSALVGSATGYAFARREARLIERRLDRIEARGIFELPPELETFLPRLPELLEKLDRLEGLERFFDFDFDQVPDLDEFGEEEMPFRLPGDRELSGAWIREVVPDSPAEAAGLRPDDLITAVDGRAVDTNHPLEALIGAYEPGDRVTITYLRGGGEEEVSVRLGENPEDADRAYLGVYFVAVSMEQRFERRMDPNQPSG